MRNGVKAVLKEDEDGRWMLGIKAFPVEVRANVDGLYTLLDINEMVDISVNCDGIMKKPRLILKLYCKLKQTENNAVRHQLALKAARAKSPMLH